MSYTEQPLYKFECKLCRKKKTSRLLERAKGGVCFSCLKPKVPPGQMSLYDI